MKAILEMFDIARNHTFGHTRVMPLLAFRDIVANKIPEKFPGLRFGFIEAAAGWAPISETHLAAAVEEKMATRHER